MNTCPRAEQECGDFKRGACFRATCKFLHGGKPASEVAGAGIPGSTNGGSAGLPTPRPAGQFMAPTDLDVNLFDPNTGFGLFGKSTFGSRFGQMTPLAKIENVSAPLPRASPACVPRAVKMSVRACPRVRAAAPGRRPRLLRPSLLLPTHLLRGLSEQ